MPTIADTIAQLADDLGDHGAATWSADDLTRAVSHALQDLSSKGVGNQSSLDHAGDGTARIKITDHTSVQHVMAVEYPLNEDPPSYVEFHVDSDGTDTWIVLHTDDLPAASESVRIYSISAFADVPHRVLDGVLTGGALYALEMEAARHAGTLNVDVWVATRYRDLADRKRAGYEARMAELPSWSAPRGKGPYRASWREID